MPHSTLTFLPCSLSSQASRPALASCHAACLLYHSGIGFQGSTFRYRAVIFTRPGAFKLGTSVYANRGSVIQELTALGVRLAIRQRAAPTASFPAL